MNQTSNNEVETELTYIKGVGPKRAQAFAEEGILSRNDLVLYFPRDYIDRNTAESLKKVKNDLLNSATDSPDKLFEYSFKREVTILCKICNKDLRVFGKRKLFSLSIEDASGTIGKILFWNRTDYFSKVYTIGQILAISGKPELDNRQSVTFTHPEIEVIEEEEADEYRKGEILPKYRLSEKMRSAGIGMIVIRRILRTALQKGSFYFEETIDDKYLSLLALPSIQDAVRTLHFPSDRIQLERARFRLKFEELLHYQLSINIKKRFIQNSEHGIVITQKSSSARTLYEKLPFELTESQKRVLREIDSDFRSGKNMNRLLQGDVGSGKTIVAILSMLMSIDAGLQVAFMAPTEILAEQHYHTLQKFLGDNFGDKFKVVQLVGGQRAKLRRDVLERIASGEANIIVGTHALFQNDINYKNLGYVIIDEQHRFGVAQRADLIALAKNSFEDKTLSPHILVMTATPIPRTLTMTVYGDLDVSIINEMPRNRKPIKTIVSFDSRREEVYEKIRDEISKGRQVYIVFPLVEKSEKLELKAATEHFDIIRNEIFPKFSCGLLHGQMFWYEKEDAMKAFLNKEYQILVATTVIEVGIDVPNASLILIENAERFGLSQLHQLRGRVGRGSEQSYCVLMTKDNYKFKLRSGDVENERTAAIIRLKTMERTTDGFEIAEVDLKLRGPGDILGTRQAGVPEFKYADLTRDVLVIQKAKELAIQILNEDPDLTKPDHKRIRKAMLAKYSNDKTFLGIA